MFGRDFVMDLLFVYTSVFTLAKSLSEFDFPQNAAVLVGQQTIINCRSEGNIWWKYKSRAESEKEVVLFNYGNFSDDCERCTINSTEPKQFDLIINNTRQSDAGTYVCVEVHIDKTNHSVTARHFAELIVIASAPECNTNLTEEDAPLIEDEYLLMWCVIEFRGNFQPTMEWKNDITGEIISSQLTIIPNRNVKSELTMKLKCDDHGVTFSCTTYFSSTNVDSIMNNFSHHRDAARNAPVYSNTWISPTVNVSRQNYSNCKNSPADSNTTAKTRHAISPEEDDKTSDPMPSSSVALLIIFVTVLLLSAAIICYKVLRKSEQGCLHNMSTEPVVLFLANNRGDENIYHEAPTESLDSMPVSRHEQSRSITRSNNSQNESQLNSDIALSEDTTLRVAGNNSGTAHHYEADDHSRSFRHEDRHGFPVTEVTAVTPAQYMGTDGTIYTEVNTARGNAAPRIMQQQHREPIQSLFSASVYASIDHTVHDIPPPRPTKSANLRNASS